MFGFTKSRTPNGLRVVAIVALSVLSSAGFMPQLLAGPVDIGAAGSTTNKTGNVKNDLEISFISDVTMRFTGTDANGRPPGGPTVGERRARTSQPR